MKNKPEITVFCGSSRFVELMAVAAWIVERDEQKITMGLHLLPYWYCENEIPDHIAEYEGVADQMDELHLRKIDLANEIFVINHKNYIGDSTRREIEYATKNGKKIRWYTSDPVADKVNSILVDFLKRQKDDLEDKS